MTRNKEIRLLFISFICIFAGGCLLITRYNSHSLIIFVLCFIIMSLIYIIFTRYRYEKIEKLSEYLVQIQRGHTGLDIRDNSEGELGILKSEIYKVTLMLTKNAEMLEKDKEYLCDALSDISHQLKTPLTSMMVMADLLNDSSLPKVKREEFTASIRSQLERIDWLVSTLLKMSKLDSGKIILKKEKVMVKELIKSSVSHLLIPMELKEQKLIIEGENTVSFTGDFAWTLEALSNIVKNCIEHTKNNGTIKISYGENSIYTHIIICDNGEGIDDEDIRNIFKRFYKGKNSNSDSVGIGLAFAKQVLLLEGGEILVKSKIGEGTEFIIKIYKRII